MLASCCGGPARNNSILEELSVAVIQERMLELNDAGVKNRWIERVEQLCVVSIRWRWFKKSDEIRVLRGVVYKINGRGPRTEP